MPRSLSFVGAIYETDVSSRIARNKQSNVWNRLEALHRRFLSNLNDMCQDPPLKSVQWEGYEMELILSPFWWGPSPLLMRYLMVVERPPIQYMFNLKITLKTRFCPCIRGCLGWLHISTYRWLPTFPPICRLHFLLFSNEDFKLQLCLPRLPLSI